ncbi:leucyl/phenylalanyl-tRNA--protein transferase [Sulfuricaulis sp.]|jgi:leucyl/phenylalanyl-tRNA--protein transferase|uniref:leucyl/phenylalanyl-tRNA--protein transferase n=1 Tax=Sulfuricaulis sp. TaxID=2003553 RepID=UPI003559C6BC
MFVLKPDAADLRFPPVELASPEGLLAVGGDLRAERLLEAYRHGIFPWYNPGQPILWWSPDPRAVLFPSRLKVARSLRKTLRRKKFDVVLDTAFRDVMQHCALPRPGNPAGGTWITPEMIEAYGVLHDRGLAHSVESWREGKLVGGLYGVAMGSAFFGESMFNRETDASKVAFVHLVRQLERWGYAFIDCQISSTHLFSLGAEEIRRHDFMTRLEQALKQPDRPGRWRFEPDLTV